MSATRPRFLGLPGSLLLAAVLLGALPGAAWADGPKVLKKVPPEFPAEAARKGVTEGVLKVKLTIDGGGAVTEVAVLEASPAKAKIFAESATEALKQWKFEGNGGQQTTEMKLVFQQD